MNSKLVFLFVGLLLLSGCGKKDEQKKTESPQNEIEGYTYIAQIDCEAFQKEIGFMNKDLIITKDHEAYAYKTDQKYSNGKNCTKFENTVDFALVESAMVYEKTKDNYIKMNFVMNDFTIKKQEDDRTIKRLQVVSKAGYSNFGIGPKISISTASTYYGIKGTNKLYSFEIEDKSVFYESSRKITYKFNIKNEKLSYEIPAGETILNISLNAEKRYYNDYLRSDKAFYVKRVTNEKECEEFVDIKCTYEWYKNEDLSRVVDKIIYYTYDLVITRDGKYYQKDLAKA